jgi:hypothetical protein
VFCEGLGAEEDVLIDRHALVLTVSKTVAEDRQSGARYVRFQQTIERAGHLNFDEPAYE